MLEVRGLSVSYRAVKALHEVSLEVRPGEIVAVLGSNGAGKSTLLRAISGLVRPRQGRILWKGRDVTGLPADRIVRLGIAHCPEGRRLFPEMTVWEHLELGAYTRSGALDREFALINDLFPVLRVRRHQAAGSLSGGEQQMVAIGRALMANPDLVMFDEPSMGLAPALVRQVARTITALNAQGKTILLVEQNVSVALRVAHRGYVLENGRIVLEGPAADLAGNELVKRAYLGA